MGTYSIKDLERLSQVKAHTIRIWEKRYDLLHPERTDTNIRYYSDADLRRLLNISLLNEHGFKISKIAELSDMEMREQVRVLGQADHGTINEVENLIVAMVELDEARFEKVINGSILRQGFEDTMIKIIQPFLQRVGVLWLVDAIKPGQEHFMTNLIRQKVITAIDGLMPAPRKDAKTVLLYLPEGEMHELGLLFGHYLARKLGHRSIYLGQSVPFEDLVAIVQHHSPEMLITGFLGRGSASHIQDYLKELHDKLPELSVRYFHGPDVKVKFDVPRFRSVQDLDELRAILL